MSLKNLKSLTILMTVTALSTVATATYNFYDPNGWNIGAGGSTYQQWDVFTANTGNTPDVGANNTYGTATADVKSPGFATGSGNFYSFSADFGAIVNVPSTVVPTPPAPPHGTHIIVQLNMGLNEGVNILPGSMTVTGATQTATLLRDDVLFEGDVYVPAMGFDVTFQERILEFWLPETGDFTIDWDQKVHAPINEIRVDSMVNYPAAFDIIPVEFIPEPATIAILGLGGILLRRRK